jgi:hypothetical protein
MKKPKNLLLMYKHSLKIVGGLLVMFGLIALVTQKTWLLSSSVLGFVFGLVIFKNWITSQQKIMESAKTGTYFFYYVSRLILFTIPLITALYFKSFFNVYITLLFLLAFQWSMVLTEGLRNFAKVKNNHSE